MVPASPGNLRSPGHPKQSSKWKASRPGKEGQAKAWTDSPYQLQVLNATPFWLFSWGQ